MQTYNLKEKDYQALHEAIAEAIESADFGLYVGEVLILKSVGRLRRQMLGLRKQNYIVARIELDDFGKKERQALQESGWSHYIVLQDLLALGSLASVIGLAKGRLGWIAGGFAAGLAAMGVERLPHWKVWESHSESFDYAAITDALIEANIILLHGKLSVLRIEPIDEESLKIKEKITHKNKNGVIM